MHVYSKAVNFGCSPFFTNTVRYSSRLCSFWNVTQVYDTAIMCSEWFIEPHTFTLQTQVFTPHPELHIQSPLHNSSLDSHLQIRFYTDTTKRLHHNMNSIFRVFYIHRRLHHNMNSIFRVFYINTQAFTPQPELHLQTSLHL